MAAAAETPQARRTRAGSATRHETILPPWARSSVPKSERRASKAEGYTFEIAADVVPAPMVCISSEITGRANELGGKELVRP